MNERMVQCVVMFLCYEDRKEEGGQAEEVEREGDR